MKQVAMALRSTISLIALLLCTTNAFAQYIVKGRVLGEGNRPLQYTNVGILSKGDSSLVKGVVTKEDGTFKIRHKAKDGILCILDVNYETVYLPLTNGDMGDITLERVYRLGPCLYRLIRPRLSLNDTTIPWDIYKVGLPGLELGGDVLKRIPNITQTSKGYEIIGKGTSPIYINGHRIYDYSQLSHLPAELIYDIKLRQNPTASHDASINALVDITAERVYEQGMTINFSSTNKQGKGFYSKEALHLMWVRSKLELFADLYGYYKEGDLNIQSTESISSSSRWTINNEGNTRKYSKYLSGTLGFRHKIRKGILGLSYNTSRLAYKSSTESTYDILKGLATYDNLGVHTYREGKSRPYHLINAYYKDSLGSLSLKANVDYLSKGSDEHKSIDEKSSTQADHLLHTDRENSTKLFTEKIHLGIPLWKGQLNIGEEIQQSRYKDRYTSTSGHTQSDLKERQETTIAPFVELSQTLGKWHLSAGLRYEYYINDHYINSLKQADVSSRYGQLYPSLLASTRFGKSSRLSLSYSARSQRPDFGQLISNSDYHSRLFVSDANPLLKPSSSHNLSATLMNKGFALTLNYAYIKDGIHETLGSYQGDELSMLSSYKNYDKYHKASFNINWHLDHYIWKPNYSLSLHSQWLSTTYAGVKQSYNKPRIELYAINNIRLHKDWRLNADYSLQSKGYDGLYYRNKLSHQLNIGVSKDFLYSKLRLQLLVEDVFGTSKDHRIIQSDKYRVTYRHNHFVRGISLNIRYLFHQRHWWYKGPGSGYDPYVY